MLLKAQVHDTNMLGSFGWMLQCAAPLWCKRMKTHMYVAIQNMHLERQMMLLMEVMFGSWHSHPQPCCCCGTHTHTRLRELYLRVITVLHRRKIIAKALFVIVRLF